MKKNALLIICLLQITSVVKAQTKEIDPAATEIWNPVPKIITAGKSAADAPSDAVQLFFAKKDSANWVSKNGKPFAWSVDDNSFMVKPGTGDIQSKQSFGDCQLHLEWKEPIVVKGEGQGRGVAAHARGARRS